MTYILKICLYKASHRKVCVYTVVQSMGPGVRPNAVLLAMCAWCSVPCSAHVWNGDKNRFSLIRFLCGLQCFSPAMPG